MAGPFEGNKPQDSPDMRKVDQKEGGDAVDSWNEWAGSRPGQPRKIEGQVDLITSINHDNDRGTTEQNVRSWYNELTPAYKNALNNPQTQVTLEGYADANGNVDQSRKQTGERCQEIKEIMQKKLGIKADIKIDTPGIDMTGDLNRKVNVYLPYQRDQSARQQERPIRPEERAERQKVEALPGSIARGFDQVPTEQNVLDWYEKLNPADKDALKDPRTSVNLTCTASRTGDADHNLELTEKSGEETKRILQEKLGVLADIKMDAVGYDEEAPAGDDRFDRQVHVDIEKSGKSGEGSGNQASMNGEDNIDMDLKIEDEFPEPIEDPIREGLEGIKKNPLPEVKKSKEAELQFEEFAFVDEKSYKDLTESPSKPKGYDFEKEVGDRLKDIPKALKGDIEKSVLGEIGKLAKVYLEGVHELKQANMRAAELTGIENALKMTTQDWLLGRGEHIQEGKPYSVQELKDRMSPGDKQKMAGDMMWCKIGNMAGDQDLERGFSRAVDAVNQVLRQAHTPETRQAALKGFSETIVPKLARDRQQRFEEIRRQ